MQLQKNFRRQTISFLLNGLLNAAFGYGCFGVIVYAGVDRHLALLAATVIGVAFNFKTTGRFVFQSSDNSRIYRFILVYLAVYGINVGGLEALMWAGISVYWAAGLLLVPCALLAFVLQKYYVFRHDQTD